MKACYAIRALPAPGSAHSLPPDLFDEVTVSKG